MDETPPTSPLPVEETPEITVPVEPPQALPQADFLPKKKSGSCLGTIGTIIVFLALFIVGVWLSSFLRQFIPSDTSSQTPNTAVQETPTPTGFLENPNDPYASWKTYQVISGVTKQPIAGVSFKLPPDVLSPICDGTGCASQGTYLPGGSRFTVAPRGAGQALRDFRGSAISDVNGTIFTTKSSVVGGRQATEFTGTFTGSTVSGYVFSSMRGMMIELSDTVSLEINHFTPSGITSDFAQDDALFDTILKTLTFPGPTPTTATSSGY